MAAAGDTSAGGKYKETRVLLIGKTGVGKSSTGNALLGQKLFEAPLGSRIVNKTSDCKEAMRSGRKLVVVDTPGFIHTDKNCEETARELSKIFGYLHQGFHAMIYVMGAEKFSGECIETRDLFLKVFGEEVVKYTIIVITHLDLLLQESFDPDDYLAFTAKEFRKLQKQCDQRVIFMDNKASEDGMEEQASQILDMVDEIGRTNDKPCFLNQHLRLANSYMLLDQMTESESQDRAKRELFRRGARALGIKRALYWDTVKHVPVNKEIGLFTSNEKSLQRKRSSPSIRPLDTPRLGQRTLPPVKEGLARRYSVCADVATMAFTPLSTPANDTVIEENSIEMIEDVQDIDFDGDVLKVLEDVGKPTDCLEVEVERDDAKDARIRVEDKDFFDQFVGFFSYFFVPMVNVKRLPKY